jgi:AAA family ATP:ADP antiporter
MTAGSSRELEGRSAAPGGPPATGPLGRLVNLFAEVHAGETATVLLLMVNIFLLLASYYLLKTIREPLILAGEGGGADVKSYSAAAIAGLLIILVPLYSALANRVSRVKLINGVTLFFISNLVAFFFLNRAGVPVGVPFFIWVGIFNLMIIAQIWAFANDVYTVEQGKRLFAIVGFGASLGAIAGSFFTGQLVEKHGPYPFMVVAAVLLGVSMVITNVVHRRESGAAAQAKAKEKAAGGKEADADEEVAKSEKRSGFSLVFSDRYLLLIACLMMILNLVNTTGEYILGETVSKIAAEEAASAGGDPEKIIGGFYGNYFTWVNVVSAIIQAFVVSRVIKYAGVRGALLVLPVVSLIGYTALAFVPALRLIKSVKIAENSLDYSLQNTTRNALYLPTSRAVKYKAKQANDTFFVRFGDVLSAGLVFAGLNWLGFAPREFALVNAGLVVIWLVIAFGLGRRFAQLAGGRQAARGELASAVR